ncbi:MAG: YihA family ribosome biogenesis GTP-binding protein [Acidobacteria bacterium]|nr:MAG: YihA family ribosome biogenesis GTP-binding protein [Acidobacteriota bacterium]PYV03538.1 MAG: YihA family ribosome biogenesis GTP-binding protein [Acidobacteriota bacterium]PYV37946.1 MAG: YihA family ribosome biogenesis GTP-binding protein [Acidobacteriota bacterium]
MKVIEAEFVASAFSPRDFPPAGLSEIVFAGRSNVGKSSLINRLVEKRNLARTSSTPGKTQSINFYRVNRSLHFVDLPGYGYAKVPKSVGRHWKKLVEAYFRSRPGIVLVLHLVDARLRLTPLDQELAQWLCHLGFPTMVVATKADKLSGNERSSQLRALSSSFEGVPVLLSSAVTGIGCKEIWKRVADTTQHV